MEDDSPQHEEAPATTPSERTGNPVVDEVLDSMERLDGRPVSEHVTVFEAAHENLRRTLSEAADAPAEAPHGDPAARDDGA